MVKPMMERTLIPAPTPMPAFAPVLRAGGVAPLPELVEIVGSEALLVKGTAPPETVVAPVKAGACVEAEKLGVAEMLSGFKTLQEQVSVLSILVGADTSTCRLCGRRHSPQANSV